MNNENLDRQAFERAMAGAGKNCGQFIDGDYTNPYAASAWLAWRLCCQELGANEVHKTSGRDDLWGWFGLSYASWLVIPRVLMHEMPDDWQRQMAALLARWDETWDTSDLPNIQITGVRKNRFVAWPHWLIDYRHPNRVEIEACRAIRTGHENENT